MPITLISNGVGFFGVPMEQIDGGIQYALLYDDNGNPIDLGGINPKDSPYAIQIGGVANTNMHPYTFATRPQVNVSNLDLGGTRRGDSLTSDRYTLTSGNDMVIWDSRTTDGTVHLFTTSGTSPAALSHGNHRYGLPGLAYTVDGATGIVNYTSTTVSQTWAIDVFDMGAGNDFVSLLYDNGTYADAIGGVHAGIEYTANATIYGGAGVDWVWSGAGNDLLFGGSENDTIYGGDNNDTLVGGGGADLLDGASGVNWVSYQDSPGIVNVILNDTQTGTITSTGSDAQGDIVRRVNHLIGSDVAGSGDTLTGNTSRNTIIGLAGNDTIYGGDDVGADVGDVMYGDDTLNAVTGNDSLFGGNGNDTGYGGLGDDFIEGSAGSDSLYGGAGNDTLSYSLSDQGVSVTLGGSGSGGHAQGDVLAADFENLLGSAFNDTLIGSSGANFVFGGDGLDSIRGAAGADTIYGGAAVDTIEGGTAGDTLAGGNSVGAAGEGDWVSYANSVLGVTVDLGVNTATGGDASGDVLSGFTNAIGSGAGDSLIGNAGINTILGLGGDDTIRGGGGADSLDGGTGASDWLSYAGSAAVTVNLGSASPQSGGDAQGDIISAFDNLIGSSNADSLTGTNSVNTIYGGAGVDTILGDAGADSLDGGGQGDWVSYVGASGVTVDLSLTTTQSGSHAAGDILAGFSNLIGSGQADSLAGTAGINTIFGGGGNDTIFGGDAGDSLDGGAGAGDWASYAGSGSPVNVDLSLATAQSGGDAQGDILGNIENLIGSGGADTLTGSSAANTIVGGLGVDTVQGGLGNDRLEGGVSLGAATDGDWLSYAAAGSGVSASFFGGTATGGAGTDSIAGFQHLIGSASGDTLEGNDDLDNSLAGRDGNDTLRGLGGIDTLDGGIGDDLLQTGNNGGTFVATSVNGWDGETGSGPIIVAVAADAARVGDFAFGGTGTDTLDMAALTSGSARTVYMRFNADGTPSSNSNIGAFLAGVEIIVAGASADIINLTFNDGVTRTAYGENVSIFAGAGADTVFSGSGDDVIAGGRQSGSVAGETGDWLYGGQGRDTIFGDDFNAASTFGGDDRLFGGGGNDTVNGGVGGDTAYGGEGIDALNGNSGDDFLYDFDAGNLNGDEGADLLVLQVTATPSNYFANGGKDDVSDGADRVFVGGTYNSVTSGLGGANDLFIASSTDSGTAQIDRVSGESGADVISSWYGNDILDGGDGGDALWGGAGVDTIIGGPDTDILYGGAGDGDLLIGGDGSDYYYWARTDGVDRIEDRDTVGGGQADNFILVQPDFDPVTGQMVAGNGVFETDHDLYDNAGGDDMVQLVDLDGAGAGTMYRLTILQGAGAGSSIEFDQTEISVIGLWNNDAMGATPVITAYVWDPIDQRYEYQA